MDEWMNGAKFSHQLNVLYQETELEPPTDLSPETLLAQAGGACQGETTLHFGGDDGTLNSWFKDKDLNLLANQSRAPILLTNGFVDMNVFPTHVDRFWKA